jgi:uncharacterized protein (DUF433 family)
LEGALVGGVERERGQLGVPISAIPAIFLRMIDWSSCPAVEQELERYSGAWVFRGTRVPIAALFENLEDDASAHQFVEWFPGVTLEQVRAVLEHAARSGLSAA